MPFSVGGLKLSIAVEHASSILYLIACTAQTLDAFIGWHHSSNLLANGLSIGKNDLFLLLWRDSGGEILEDLPLGTGLAHAWARDGRREDNASFSAGLGAATALLITSLCWEEHNGISGINQHLCGDINILVHTQR